MNCTGADSSPSAPTRYIQMDGKIDLSRETIGVGCTNFVIWLTTPKADGEYSKL